MLRSTIHIFLLATPLAAAVDFSRDVQPIFNKNCIACHGGVKEAGDVSFIFRDQILGKGESGRTVVVPGDPKASEMIARITTDDPDDLMPKPEHGPRLSDADVETLRQWISEGAEWGEHWSFVAQERHELPSVEDTSWPVNEIDRFILAKLENEGLEPSPVAKPSEWLRRASLDLIGLPPTIAELDVFEAAAEKDFPAAIEKETERLLASPHFGERWASVWMDLARYADSEGLGNDGNRDVWKYRDWIIKAFNDNLPYDQFIVDQLAGDLVSDSTLDQKLATTFHRLTQANSEGGTDDEEFRLLAAMDRSVTTWEVFQGLSMSCVQCHSHPYDPIKHEEYYTSLSFFNNARDADAAGNAPMLPIPLDRRNYPKANELIERINNLEQSIYDKWASLDSKTTWHPVTQLNASSPTAEMSIVDVDGFAEFRATDNAQSGSVYTLDATPPAKLTSLSALRLTYLPKDEKKALTDAEWGASLNHIKAEKINADGKAEPLKLIDVIADEAHPLRDPLGSLRGGDGWGTHYKFFRPRHATFVLEQPAALAAGETIRLTLKNGGTYLASFPMVAKRGRIALSADPAWITMQSDPGMVSVRRELQQSETELAKIPNIRIPVIAERDPEHSRVTSFFNRGNWLDKGDVITASDTPHVFPPLKAESGKPTRLDLAKWIASPRNPLTSRVAVNRFWLELFGVGIVPTPEDFGSAGEKPTHPELLDTLAVEFATDMDWNIKNLLRRMVTSATYRQASAVSPELYAKDADNRLLARGPRQRLTGEMARDAALTAAGLLHPEVYGKPTYPPLPPGVWTPFVDANRWKTPEPGDPQRYRRAAYIYWKRSIPYPTFSSFDAPTREMCSKRRMPSNTPVQALAVMNDPAFHECAQGLARRMKYETDGTLQDKLSLGYRATTSRKITPERLTELTKLFEDLEQTYEADPGLMEDMAGTPDGAAFTVVASVLLNLDEAITR